MKRKISSVLELARYKIGDSAFWVRMRPIGQDHIDIPEGEEWMAEQHPKVLHERGYNQSWHLRARLPRLCAVEFDCVVALLTSEFVVEEFIVEEIERSNHTGEFVMRNQDGDWMPSDYLFDTIEAARLERERLKKLLRRWAQA